MSTPFGGSGDSNPDIYIWEIGGGEGYTVEVSADLNTWTYVGEVGPGLPGERGYDVDAYGFDQYDQLLYVRITDLAHLNLSCNPGQSYSITGADIDAVGVLSRPVYADLAIEKTSNIADGTALAEGDEVEYTFTVSNTGTVDLTGVTVSDALPNLSDISPASQDIAAGDSATFTATYEITQADINNGEVVNSATATGEPPVDCTSCDTPTSPPGTTTITIPQEATMTVVKTADTEGPVALGDEITYTFEVENTGNVTITDATITDGLPGVTWVSGPNVGDLEPGDTATGTATYVTTEADIIAGSVVNSATVTGTPPESCVDCDPTSPPSEETVTTETPTPALSVIKQANTEGPVALGDTIEYTFLVENTGNMTLDPVTITDELPGLVWVSGPDLGALAPGEQATGSATYVTTEADLVNGSVVNSATGTGIPPEACVDCGPVTITPPPVTVTTEEPVTGLEITKEADVTAPVNVGDTITYTFSATNTGTVTLEAVTITDELPGLTWITGPDLGPVAPGATVYGSASYVTTEADVANGVVANSASGTGTPRDCASCDTPFSPPVNVNVPTANPALGLVKEADTAGPVNVGDTITYTFTVSNTGNVPLDDVVLADPLPGLAWITGPELGTIEVGGSATGSASYTVTEADVAAGVVTNSATATCATCGEGTPPSSVDVPTVAPGLTLVKEADTAGPVAVGDVITYTFTATNTGNVAIDEVTIADTLPGLTWITGPELGNVGIGESISGTATYTVTQVDVNAGGVANSATASGTPEGGDLVTTPPSDVFVPAEQGTMGLVLDKMVSPNTTVEAGDTVTYTFVVTNIGQTTVDNVTVTDVLPGLGEIAGPHGTALDPGETATFTASYVVTEADATLGVLSNTATATGTGTGDTELSAVDTARVRACTVPQPTTSTPEPQPTEDVAGTPAPMPTEEIVEETGTPAPIETEEPVETEPVETEPTEPVETEPTEPVETEPTEPVETEPTEPVETEPTEPVETEPTEPVETEPTEPVETEPTEPVETEPTDGEAPQGDDAGDTAPQSDEMQGFIGARTEGSRGLFQEAPAEEELADCVPLAPEPDPDPTNPAPPQPNQPAPPSNGGGAVSGGGGGSVVTHLPKTGQTGETSDQTMVIVGGLVLLAVSAIGLGLVSRGSLRTRKG